MPVSIKVGSAWKTATAVFNKVGGVWKTAADMPVKIGGVWKTGILASSSFESIATVNANGSATSVTFSSIPQTYTSLQIRFMAKNGNASTALPIFNFNGDIGSNYSYHRLEGSGSAANSSGATTRDYIQIINFPTNVADIFGVAIADIHNYSSTTQYKTLRSFNGFDANGSGNVSIGSGLWQSTSAITSITIGFQGDAYPATSTFSLYGIKGA